MPQYADVQESSTGYTGAPDRSTLAAFVALVVLGGASVVFVRYMNAELAPVWGAGFRLGLTALLLAAVAAVTRPEWPRGRALAGAIVYGVLNFGLCYAFVYVGLVQVSAGTTIVVLSVVPLMTLLLAVLQRVEPFKWRGLAGSLVAGAGVAILFADQVSPGVSLLSLMLVLASGLCVAETGVAVKWFPRVDPIAQNVIGLAVGVAVLLPISLLLGETWALPTRAETWFAVAFLVLLGTGVYFVLNIYVLHRWTASATSYTFLLFPIVTLIVGGVLLGETVTPVFLIGGALVLLGVYAGALRGGDEPKAIGQPAPSGDRAS
jgi:drug/metabolite transporter (DMT)-like permease